MRLNNRCSESGHTSIFRPNWLKEGESWNAGRQITCACGKTVKLRMPMNGGRAYAMIPHHNKPV
jgi:hypothetical protein